MLGDPQRVVDRIEVVFASQHVAVVCHIADSIVKVEISTLDLADKDLEKNLESWIERAATDVAATVRWVEER